MNRTLAGEEQEIMPAGQPARAGDDAPRGGPDAPAAAGVADWLGLLPGELEGLLAGMGEPAYRGRQIFSWFHGRQVTDFTQMTDLPKALRQRLAAGGGPAVPVLRRLQVDPLDGTRKYLLELADGQLIETVLMRHRYGLSLCVSTQVGCRMGCRFCASTIGGLARNLTAGEIAGQLLVVNRDLAARGERVSHLVLMGIGEPLENMEAVVRFMRLAHEPRGAGIGYRHMTISTSGLVPGIRRLAREGLPVTLAVSLHAPNDEIRSYLMPVNRKWPIAQVLDACREYVELTGRRVTFEYVLLEEVNDRPEHARELAERIRGLLCHVNLIPWNPVSERPFRAPGPERVRAFYEELVSRGVQVTVRRELGQRIDAACGQLRRHALAGRARAGGTGAYGAGGPGAAPGRPPGGARAGGAGTRGEQRCCALQPKPTPVGCGRTMRMPTWPSAFRATIAG